MNITIFTNKFKKTLSIEKAETLNDIIGVFETLNTSYKNKDLLGQIITVYLYSLVEDKDKRNRKVTARVFEDFVAELLNGRVTDKESRANIVSPILQNLDPYLVKYIVSNRREKIDVMFGDSYGVSMKTSVLKNKEINMGSFAREALFKDFLTKEEYGSERKGGLGSKPQILKTFNIIKQRGKYKQFADRFRLMVENIYIDDFIFVMKGDTSIDWYFLEANVLQKILVGFLESSPEDAIKIINRYEGNSIRIDRTELLKNSSKITMDFSHIKESKVYELLNQLDDFSNNVLLNLIDKNISGANKDLHLIEEYLNKSYKI